MRNVNPETTREHFFKLLHDFPNAMLVTRTAEGDLHSRPMAVAEVDDDGDMWLATDVHSEKISELTEDAHVSVSLQNDETFVAISGKAEVVRDPGKVQSFWDEAWRIWFPKGPEDPNLVLIRVKPAHGEYWDTSGISTAKFLYDSAKAYVTGTRPHYDPGEQAKIEL